MDGYGNLNCFLICAVQTDEALTAAVLEKAFRHVRRNISAAGTLTVGVWEDNYTEASE